jgi:hypothetical protein
MRGKQRNKRDKKRKELRRLNGEFFADWITVPMEPTTYKQAQQQKLLLRRIHRQEVRAEKRARQPLPRRAKFTTRRPKKENLRKPSPEAQPLDWDLCVGEAEIQTASVSSWLNRWF